MIDNPAGEVSFAFDTLLTAISGVTGSGLLAAAGRIGAAGPAPPRPGLRRY